MNILWINLKLVFFFKLEINLSNNFIGTRMNKANFKFNLKIIE